MAIALQTAQAENNVVLYCPYHFLPDQLRSNLTFFGATQPISKERSLQRHPPTPPKSLRVTHRTVAKISSTSL